MVGFRAMFIIKVHNNHDHKQSHNLDKPLGEGLGDDGGDREQLGLGFG